MLPGAEPRLGAAGARPGAARHRGSAHSRGIPTRSCGGKEPVVPHSRHPGTPKAHPKAQAPALLHRLAPGAPGEGASDGVELARYGARPGPAARSAVMQPVMKGPTRKGGFQVSFFFFLYFF